MEFVFLEAEAMGQVFRIPVVTRRRMWLAFAIAVVADAVQLALGPLGWTFFDQIIDVIAMVLLTLVIGFHPLFLPTFLLEFFPVVDMLPTWTGCVAVVVALRRRAPQSIPAPPVSSPPPDTIDI
jgi:hypothetical protein